MFVVDWKMAMVKRRAHCPRAWSRSMWGGRGPWTVTTRHTGHTVTTQHTGHRRVFGKHCQVQLPHKSVTNWNTTISRNHATKCLCGQKGMTIIVNDTLLRNGWSAQKQVPLHWVVWKHTQRRNFLWTSFNAAQDNARHNSQCSTRCVSRIKDGRECGLQPAVYVEKENAGGVRKRVRHTVRGTHCARLLRGSGRSCVTPARSLPALSPLKFIVHIGIVIAPAEQIRGQNPKVGAAAENIQLCWLDIPTCDNRLIPFKAGSIQAGRSEAADSRQAIDWMQPARQADEIQASRCEKTAQLISRQVPADKTIAERDCALLNECVNCTL